MEAVVRNDPNRINGLYINLVNIKKITPEIIQNLSGLKEQVIALKLNEIKLESDELQFLSELKHLNTLQLSGTNLTDAGLMQIKDLPDLQNLNLYGTQVTDQSLEVIGRLKNIRTITLWNTRMTHTAIRQFSKQHPEILLEFGELTLNKTDSLQKQ
jgi:oligoribonuclease (3'-5' exoribonuclease)